MLQIWDKKLRYSKSPSYFSMREISLIAIFKSWHLWFSYQKKYEMYSYKWKMLVFIPTCGILLVRNSDKKMLDDYFIIYEKQL